MFCVFWIVSINIATRRLVKRVSKSSVLTNGEGIGGKNSQQVFVKSENSAVLVIKLETSELQYVS